MKDKVIVETISVEEGLAMRESRVGVPMDAPVWDIPVLFQVRANTEDEGAELVGMVLGDADVRSTNWVEEGDEREIESWLMPNHRQVDGNDAPVTVEILRIEPDYSERLGTNSMFTLVAGQREALIAELQDKLGKAIEYVAEMGDRELVAEMTALMEGER